MTPANQRAALCLWRKASYRERYCPESARRLRLRALALLRTAQPRPQTCRRDRAQGSAQE